LCERERESLSGIKAGKARKMPGGRRGVYEALRIKEEKK
jgi:hypothetical protein